MREIKFRGLTANGKWVYGTGIFEDGVNTWLAWHEKGYPLAAGIRDVFGKHGGTSIINPETIGQYTGLTDKNSVEVYAKDRLGGVWGDGYIDYCDKCKSFEYFMDDFGCACCSGDVMWSEIVEDEHKLEVTGNIYETSKLVGRNT